MEDIRILRCAEGGELKEMKEANEEYRNLMEIEVRGEGKGEGHWVWNWFPGARELGAFISAKVGGRAEEYLLGVSGVIPEM